MISTYPTGALSLLCCLLCLQPGCTRAGFFQQHDGSARRDGADAERLMDAAPVDSSPLGSFSVPKPLAALQNEESDTDEGPALTADMLELYFVSLGRSASVGYEDIWFTTRASLEAPWEPPRLVPGVNTPDRESSPTISRDGLTLYFAAHDASNIWVIHVTTRSSRSAPWAAPEVVHELDNGNDNLPSDISDDGLQLLFHGGPDWTSIYRVTRADRNSPWGAPRLLEELSTSSFDAAATLAAGGRVAIFDSDRDGGAGLRDIYMAQRASPNDAFDQPLPLTILNTKGNDAAPWISEDLRTVLFSRSPPDSTGIFSKPFRIYEARR